MVNSAYHYVLIGLLGVLPTSICSAQSFISDKTVRAQVLTVMSRPSDIEQAAAAEDLFDMVKGKNLDHVHSQTIQMVSDLMSNNSESVTIWIAATLGEFRGRASFAAPRLIEALKKAECRRVDESSEFIIRTALKRIGENVTDSECSKIRNEPAKEITNPMRNSQPGASCPNRPEHLGGRGRSIKLLVPDCRGFPAQREPLRDEGLSRVRGCLRNALAILRHLRPPQK